MALPSRSDDYPGESRRARFRQSCHREPRRGAAISRYRVLILKQYQEIATACGLAMTEVALVRSVCLSWAVIQASRRVVLRAANL